MRERVGSGESPPLRYADSCTPVRMFLQESAPKGQLSVQPYIRGLYLTKGNNRAVRKHTHNTKNHMSFFTMEIFPRDKGKMKPFLIVF